MFRYVIAVDDTAWTFGLTGDPVHVAVRARLDEVEFWAEHTDGAPMRTRRFQMFGTGQPLPGNARWVGTCPRAGGLVWHLYELAGDEEAGRDG